MNDVEPRDRRRRVHDPGRPVGLREVDAAADDRRAWRTSPPATCCIGGERVNEKAPRDRNLAMVFQNYALYPHLTVFENIAFPLRLRKLADDEVARAGRARRPSMLELDRAPRPQAGQLSGGQRQRVAMGRAIVRDADAFLFDEPLSNLDAKLRGQMRTEISRLQQRARHHDRLRHPRPGRGHDARRPGGGAAQGRAAAGGHAPRALRAAGQPVRGRVHRLAGHELPAGDGRGRHSCLPFGDVELHPRPGASGSRGPRRPHRRHPARALRGRRPGSTTPTGARRDLHRPRSTSSSGSGSEQYAYIPFEAPARGHASRSQELAAELDSEQIRTQLVVTLDADSRIPRAPRPSCGSTRPRCTSSTPSRVTNITHGRGVDSLAPGPAWRRLAPTTKSCLVAKGSPAWCAP